jgi:hypothetical protein
MKVGDNASPSNSGRYMTTSLCSSTWSFQPMSHNLEQIVWQDIHQLQRIIRLLGTLHTLDKIEANMRSNLKHLYQQTADYTIAGIFWSDSVQTGEEAPKTPPSATATFI